MWFIVYIKKLIFNLKLKINVLKTMIELGNIVEVFLKSIE